MLRLTVRRRIILVLVVVLVVPLSVANVIWLWASQAELRSAAADRQILLVESSASAVTNFIDDKVNAAIIHSQSTGVQTVQLAEAEPELTAYLKQDTDLTTVTLVDASGEQRLAITRSGVTTTPVNVATSDAFRVVSFLGGEDYISPVSFDANHEGYVTIAVPLVSYADTLADGNLSTSQPGVILPTSAIKGALIVRVALTQLWGSVLSDSLGHTGYAYVVDDHGRLIAHPQAKFAANHSSLAHVQEVQDAVAQPPLVPGAALPTPVPRETISETGVPVLSSYYRVARTGWIVVAEEPIASVYGPVSNEMRVAASFFALSCVVGLFLILLTVRSLLDPIRALTDGANKLAGGDLGFRISIKRRDEFGFLAQTFNNMAAKLQTDIVQLRDIDGLKNEFIAIASHNLRTPLTVIKGYLDVIDDDDMPPDTASMLHGIEASAHELSAFSEDLLTISSIESGYAVLNIASISVGDLLSPVHEEASAAARNKGVTLTWSVADPDFPVRLSPAHIRSAASNLLGNAIEFTPKGGKVSLEAVVEDGVCVITVRDTGVGIAPEEMARLFTKFHRGTSTMRYEHPGIGIGLYATGMIVQAHHGRITARSQPGVGSTFVLNVPIQDPEDVSVQ